MAAGVEDSTVGEAASTAVASVGITEAGVELAGMAAGVVMAGTEAGVGTAGTEAGVTQAGVGELASALVGVLIGRVIRIRTAIRTITPIIHIIRTMGRMRMGQQTPTGIAVATEIRATTRSSRIRSIQGRRERLA